MRKLVQKHKMISLFTTSLAQKSLLLLQVHVFIRSRLFSNPGKKQHWAQFKVSSHKNHSTMQTEKSQWPCTPTDLRKIPTRSKKKRFTNFVTQWEEQMSAAFFHLSLKKVERASQPWQNPHPRINKPHWTNVTLQSKVTHFLSSLFCHLKVKCEAWPRKSGTQRPQRPT